MRSIRQTKKIDARYTAQAKRFKCFTLYNSFEKNGRAILWIVFSTVKSSFTVSYRLSLFTDIWVDEWSASMSQYWRFDDIAIQGCNTFTRLYQRLKMRQIRSAERFDELNILPLSLMHPRQSLAADGWWEDSSDVVFVQNYIKFPSRRDVLSYSSFICKYDRMRIRFMTYNKLILLILISLTSSAYSTIKASIYFFEQIDYFE